MRTESKQTRAGDLTDGEKRIFVHVGTDRNTVVRHLEIHPDGKMHTLDGNKYAVSVPVAKDQAECCGNSKSEPLAPMPDYSPLLTEDHSIEKITKQPKVDTK
jgi:hypothetical protein